MSPSAMSVVEEKKKPEENSGSRMKEIRQILMRNHITRGVTPEKLRVILEELGPRFVKLGQIMSLHSDILPRAYCDELMKLTSEVTPMPFSVVEDVINGSLGANWEESFEWIDEKPLGSASIAQVHRARLKSGDEVILKVQRKGIYDTMARDISLLHRLVRPMQAVSSDLRNIVDLDMVLDEMWSVAQEEMDFLKEAANIEEFTRNNKDISYVAVPKLYHEYCTSRVLCMEYIGGWPIDDVKDLKENGYDLDEIGSKLVNNFIKQVMDDGFFHADPHPGNVKIQAGKIVWIDMGMMGRLNDHDRKVMAQGVRGIALHDIVMVENAVLEIGDVTGKPDRGQLYKDLKGFLEVYGSAGMGDINVADMANDLMEIMKLNKIRLPHGVTMLCRGLTQMQGVLSNIAPDTNMFSIASQRISEDYIQNLDWKVETQKNARNAYRIVQKGAEIPSLAVDIMKEYLNGTSEMNISLHSAKSLTNVINSAVRNIVIGLCVAALLVSSSIICTTDMTPKAFGIPLLGFLGYAIAFTVSVLLLIRYVWRKLRNPKPRKEQ